ncbi:MAG: hypothetical protein KatS3mg087_1120 [Patescibacteria group bacterium]|nr:MAG: hypothetical protein KatS3mg087_1120 [Patescibacteria group bacterium]
MDSSNRKLSYDDIKMLIDKHTWEIVFQIDRVTKDANDKMTFRMTIIMAITALIAVILSKVF